MKKNTNSILKNVFLSCYEICCGLFARCIIFSCSYAVTRRELKDFTRDVAIKNEEKSLKVSLEKALLFMDNREVPPSWDKESLLGSDDEEDELNTRKSVVGLVPVYKDYAWGIRGMDSRVARYALESKVMDEVDPDTPYAELWIGTHPKGPSKLKTGEVLSDAIGEELPFLFKILSADLLPILIY